MAGLTPFQTVGPYLHIGLRAGLGPMTAAHGGPPISIVGRLLDGAATGISDGVIEFWSSGYDGVGRATTGADGGFRLTTTRPPARPDPDGSLHAPHFAVRVLARGILTEYITRVYFADDPANSGDPVLQTVPAERRGTLLAHATSASEYRFDIVVQGSGETVFFLV